MKWDEGLAGRVLRIAATDEKRLRVMAGPGTGKSFALKRRVARLLENGEDPRRILAVTFTRNAAASLLDDLHALGVADCNAVRVGTLHAFCFSLLSQQDVFGVLNRVPRPIVTFTTSGVLRFEGGAMLDDLSAAGQFGSKRDCTRRIRAFEAAWARLQSDVAGWPQDPVDRAFHDALLSWLRFHRAILIGEVVPEALRFLRNNPTAAACSAFDHVIVDEYQDLNRAEQELIDLLAGRGSLAVVGDEDQSIYRFRHANPEGIVTFGCRHPTTHDETLDECRRCPTRVVAIADNLIRNNHTDVTAVRLLPNASNPAGEVHIVQWEGIAAEALGLAGYVCSLVRSGRYAPEEILVLAPLRLFGRGIRDRIAETGVPVHSFFHDEAMASQLAQRAIAVLALLVDREDRVALRWWLAAGGSTRRAYQRLRLYCETSGLSPRTALEELRRGNLALSGVASLVARYTELVEVITDLSSRPLAEVVEAVLPADNEDCAMLREMAMQALSQVQSVDELCHLIRTQITQPEMPKDGTYVRVMSVHKAKGLTSKVAIVAGCTEGVIPTRREGQSLAEQDADLREQRRLCYVAITRCTELLVLSSVSSIERRVARQIGARIQPGGSTTGRTVASQFLDELGPTAPASRTGAQWIASGYAP